MISFASDNNAGIHPAIMEAIQNANFGDQIGYGADEYTAKAEAIFQNLFKKDVSVFFVFNGTAANVLSIEALLRPHQAVVCSNLAHINVDECGAPEKIAGCKLLQVPNNNGKIYAKDIEPLMHSIGFEHHSQPAMISISQTTELGTIYTVDELNSLATFAHDNNMFLHVDGARIANAAAFLNVDFNTLLVKTGVDVVSFGGTKNGLMLGEAVVFINNRNIEHFKYLRKQNMQLASKMRFIASQFIALLENDLWKQNAEHANTMAQKLAENVSIFPQLKIMYPVESNAVFVKIPPELINPLKEKYFFYTWDEQECIVRWMTSFKTKTEDIDNFVACIAELLKTLDL